MDYEKKYKEALERARQFSEHPLQEDSSNIVEYIFPELQESKDERIRKEIIETFKNLGDGKIPVDINYADIFTWLEKQEGCEYIKKDWLEHIKQSWYKEGFIDGKYSGGTSKEWTINDAATLKELIDFLENGTAKLQHDLTKYANWLKIQFTPIEKQGEQKPAWSEGDEKMLHNIENCVHQCVIVIGTVNKVRYIDWLKSIKQRIGGEV